MTEISRLEWTVDGGYFALIERCECTSQNTSENYSIAHLQLALYCGRSISFDRRNAFLHNSDWFGLNYSYPIGETILKDIYGIKVEHESDGSKTAGFGYGIDTSYGLSGTATGYFTFPKLNRKATISSNANLSLIGKNTEQILTFINPGKLPLKLQYIWNGNVEITKTLGKVTKATVTFTQDELIKLYKVKNYTLKVNTYNNENYSLLYGYTDKNGLIEHQGIIRIRKDNTMKEALPFIRKNGSWNIAIANIYKTQWKKQN